MKLYLKAFAAILFLYCFFAIPLVAQSDSTGVVTSSPDIIYQIKIWLGIAIFFLTEIISANIKTPFSLSLLTYIVNALDSILSFIKKIRPDNALKSGDSHYSNPV